MSVRRVSSVLISACALILFASAVAIADPGDLDTSFGTLGRTSIDFVGNDQAHAIDRQSTGRIVVAGDDGGTSVQVFRLRAGGTQDTGFGVGGSTILSIPNTTEVHVTDLAIQANDRIVVVGWARAVTGFDKLLIMRFRANGTPDGSFGDGGIRRIGFEGRNAFSYGVAVQSNGRIVISIEVNAPDDDSSRFGLVRLLAGGAFDGSFGTGGRRFVTMPDSFEGFDGAWRVRVMADGRLVAAGWNQLATGYRSVVVRLHPGGRLDRSFSGDGIATVNAHPGSDSADALEVVNGKVVLGIGGVTGTIVVVRLRANGARDDSFSGDGLGSYSVANFNVADVAIQSDGKIVVSDSSAARLVRIRPGGARESGFGSSGVASDPLGPDADAIELQAGRILIAGSEAGVSIVSRFLGS